MADQKLTDKGSLSSFDDSDLIHVVDVSDTSSSAQGTSKKGLWSLVKSTLKTYFDTIYSSDVEIQGLIEGTGTSFANALTNANTINSLVTTIYNAGGGTILMPKGVYVISESINLKPKVSIKGHGIGVTTIKIHKDVIAGNGSANNENIINIQDLNPTGEKHDVTISDLTLNFDIDDIINNGTDGVNWNTRVTTTDLDNIGNCIKATGDTTNTEYLDGLNIINCEILNAGFHGVAVYELVKNVRIENNKSNGNFYRAFHVHASNAESSENVFVRGNSCDNNGRNGSVTNGGIFTFFINVKRVVITDNIVTNDSGGGINVVGALASGTVAEQCIVANNVVDGSLIGYTLGGGAKNYIVNGNTAVNNTSVGYNVTNVNRDDGLVFSNNIAENNGDRGLYIRDTDYAVFTGNLIKNNNKTQNAAGVDIENSKYLNFTGNQIIDNGADTPSFNYQLRIAATTLGGSDYIRVTENTISSIANSTANPIAINGGTAGAPNVRYLELNDNSIRRGESPTSTVISMTAQGSTVKHNKVFGGVISDLMTSSDNLIVGESSLLEFETAPKLDANLELDGNQIVSTGSTNNIVFNSSKVTDGAYLYQFMADTDQVGLANFDDKFKIQVESASFNTFTSDRGLKFYANNGTQVMQITNTNTTMYNNMNYYGLNYIQVGSQLQFKDNTLLLLGSGNDLQIRHNGTDNIFNSLNGDLKIQDNGTDRFTFGRTTGNFVASGVVRTAGYTVATLPSGTQGDRAFVTDANATTFASTVAGGGANVVPVFYDGTNWIIA